MTKFLDIADEGQRGTTPLRGNDVDIVGLQARQIARLLVNHPTAKVAIEGGQVDLFKLVELAPDAMAACIAYGTGYDDDPAFDGNKDDFDKAAKRAMKLSAGEQADAIMAIFDLSFGERLNPFVKKLWDSAVTRIEGSTDNLVDKTGRPPSLQQLRSALVSTTRPEQFGATHQGNSPATPS